MHEEGKEEQKVGLPQYEPVDPDRTDLEVAQPGLVVDEEAVNEVDHQVEALQMREPLLDHEDPPVDRMIPAQMARQDQAQEAA